MKFTMEMDFCKDKLVGLGIQPMVPSTERIHSNAAVAFAFVE
ncbi:hypothetical protein [Dyadobacter sp. 50-39]|nr:hypothetical protein [Dyadobacter sp. 50-39]